MRVTTDLHGEVTVLPYPHATPMTETLEWLTDVFTGHSGSDETIPLRRSPRQGFNIQVPIPESHNRAAFNLVYGGIPDTWCVPAWFDAQSIGALPAGSSSISVSTQYADFRDSSLAIVWESVDKWEIVEVDTVNANDLQLSGTTAKSYTDAAYVVPARVCRLSPDVQRLTNNNITALQMHFVADDNKQLTVAAPTQYESNDLYLEAPSFSAQGGFEDVIKSRIDVIDHSLGIVDTNAPWTHNRRSRDYRFVRSGRSDIWSFREWLHRRSGRFRKFWAPTFETDFEVLSTGTVTDTLQVRSKNYDIADNRDHIIFWLNGTWQLPRKISSYTELSNDRYDLTLSSALNVNAESIDRVSYLGLMRLNTDRIEITWRKRDLVVSSMPVLEVSP